MGNKEIYAERNLLLNSFLYRKDICNFETYLQFLLRDLPAWFSM